MITAVINQPYFFPQLHWWNRAAMGRMIVLDEVQHSTSHPSSRALCRDQAAGKPTWLTIPTDKSTQKLPINKVLVSLHQDRWGWQDMLGRKLREWYRHAPFVDEALALYWGSVERGGNTLIEYLRRSLALTAQVCNLPFDVLYQSRMAPLPSGCKKSERLVLLCQEIGASRLILGHGSAGYFKEDQLLFQEAGILVEFQMWACTTDNNSVLDAVARHGVSEVRRLVLG